MDYNTSSLCISKDHEFPLDKHEANLKLPVNIETECGVIKFLHDYQFEREIGHSVNAILLCTFSS